MLEENKIVDQAQQVMEKLCALAKENCEKKFNKYKKEIGSIRKTMLKSM